MQLIIPSEQMKQNPRLQWPNAVGDPSQLISAIWHLPLSCSLDLPSTIYSEGLSLPI